MPDTIAVMASTCPAEALVRRLRRPAAPDFMARRLAAAVAGDGRQQVVEACRAELAWSQADVAAIAAGLKLPIDPDSRSAIPLHERTRLPHEHAAARVLNAWGHLHPLEARARACWTRLHRQRRAGWTDRAAGSARDLRWYLAERRRQKPLFAAAVAIYRQHPMPPV
jgi:hypothetical protein